MKVNTLFPSRSKDGKTKGGVVLVKLDRKKPGSIDLRVHYENREGETRENTRQIRFGDRKPEYFENTGVRKAVVLSRYAELMKEWIKSETEQRNRSESSLEDDRYPYQPGEQERQSTPLTVSERYRQRMKDFRTYLEEEKKAIGDENLQQEIDTLERILDKTG